MRVVVPCAGRGSRLGADIPKVLLNVGGAMIMDHICSALDDADEIVFVAGYKAEYVQAAAMGRSRTAVYRNERWDSTGPAASAVLGMTSGLNLVIDGDVIPTREDVRMLKDVAKPCVGVRGPTGTRSSHVEIRGGHVVSFGPVGYGSGPEWACIAVVEREWFKPHHHFIYQALEPHLPLQAVSVAAHEIDTHADLEAAARWMTRR